MPLTMIEKPEIQEEEASFTPLIDGAKALQKLCVKRTEQLKDLLSINGYS